MNQQFDLVNYARFTKQLLIKEKTYSDYSKTSIDELLTSLKKENIPLLTTLKEMKEKKNFWILHGKKDGLIFFSKMILMIYLYHLQN